MQLGSTIVTPTARNIGFVFYTQLSFSTHISTMAPSCRFSLHNIKIRPFLSVSAAQLVIQALAILQCSSGRPSCTTNPLLVIQNAAAHLVFNQPYRTHVTLLLISLHWLRLTARIKIKVLMQTFRTATGTAPSYLSSLYKCTLPLAS